MAVDTARISAEARQVEFRRGLLLVLAAVLYGIGWTARRVFVLIWRAIAWSWTAIRLGWQEAAPKRT